MYHSSLHYNLLFTKWSQTTWQLKTTWTLISIQVNRYFEWVQLALECLHTFEMIVHTVAFYLFLSSNCHVLYAAYQCPLGYASTYICPFAKLILNYIVCQWNCYHSFHKRIRQSIHKHGYVHTLLSNSQVATRIVCCRNEKRNSVNKYLIDKKRLIGTKCSINFTDPLGKKSTSPLGSLIPNIPTLVWMMSTNSASPLWSPFNLSPSLKHGLDMKKDTTKYKLLTSHHGIYY